MNHAPGAGSIAWPAVQHATTVLRLSSMKFKIENLVCMGDDGMEGERKMLVGGGGRRKEERRRWGGGDIHIDTQRITILELFWSVYVIQCIAEWLRRWTRDQAVCGSIPAALFLCKSLRQALNPRYLRPPSSNGYQVERKNWYFVNGFSCRKYAAFSPGRWDCGGVSSNTWR